MRGIFVREHNPPPKLWYVNPYTDELCCTTWTDRAKETLKGQGVKFTGAWFADDLTNWGAATMARWPIEGYAKEARWMKAHIEAKRAVQEEYRLRKLA